MPDEEFEGAMTMKSPKYKTSLLYGTKLMVLPKDLYDMLVMFVKKIRPVLVKKYQSEDGKLGN